MRRIGLIAGTMILFSGCGLVESEVCETIALAGIVVDVLDSRSGLPIEDGLSGTIEDGNYLEPMFVGPGQLTGAHGRPGTYDVDVAAQGYESFTIEDVRVEEGTCQVRKRKLTVELEPA